MSEQSTTSTVTTTAAPGATPGATPGEGQPSESARTDWDVTFEGLTPVEVKSALDNSRKWESRAKANKEAADKLASLEQASKSAEEQAAERLRALEERADLAEARSLRREIALEHKLSADDATLLDGVKGDEDTLRSLAMRLAAKAETGENAAGVGFHVDQRGRTVTPPTSKDEQARAFFGI